MTKNCPKNESLNRDLLNFLYGYGTFQMPPGESSCPGGSEYVLAKGGRGCFTLRFWWTESPSKNAQKSTCESRCIQKRTLESKCTLLSARKCTHIFRLAPNRAQEIAHKSKSLKKSAQQNWFLKIVLRRVSQSKERALKRVCYSVSESLKRAMQPRYTFGSGVLCLLTSFPLHDPISPNLKEHLRNML